MASIAIERRAAQHGPPDELGTSGGGESTLVLWRFADGLEVIETNGDPVWETEDGFAELRSAIMGG